MAKLSVIIPVYNMNASLNQCLLTIRETVRLPYEVIIVDDGSSGDECVTVPPAGDDVRVLRSEEHRGFSHAVNMGIRASVGEVLLFLHADILLAPHTVEDMLDALIADSSLGAVSACAVRVYERAQVMPDLPYQGWDSFVAAAEEIRARGKQPHPEILAEMIALMAPRAVVIEAGLLDEQYQVPALAAYDYTIRMTRAGYGVASLPSVYIHHIEHPLQNIKESQHKQREERALFSSKWGVSLAYSFQMRTDLFPLMDLTRDGLKVLEIGCACGATLREIGAHNPTIQLFGVELNEAAAAIASPFVKVLSMDVEKLEPKKIPVRFDYIIMGDVIEHLMDPWSVLTNMRELLVPGGAVIASIPNVAHISNLHNLLRGYWSYREMGLLDRTHIRFFTKHEIVNMVQNAGLIVQEIRPNRLSLSDPERELLEELMSLRTICLNRENLDTFGWFVAARRPQDTV